VSIPGILRVFETAHRRLGRLPWTQLFEPAIRFAEDGWLVRPHTAMMFALDEQPYGRLPYVAKLNFTADGRRLYMRTDGTPKKGGDAVRNPELAATLRTLARDGADAFYKGAIADRIVADMRAGDGLITAADLEGYAPSIEEPLRVTYRGYDLAVPAPPAGGVMVAEMLRILERFDLVALGHNSADYIRVCAEAMKIAGFDKETHIGDPKWVPPPLDRLLSDAYAEECAARIRRGERAELRRVGSDSQNTTHISCVDAEGMVVSLTHTLGTPSGVMPPGGGFMLNGAMNWYDPRPGRAGSLAPGKRRYSSMTPTIVFSRGKPVVAVGAPGGAWITVAVLQVLLNVIDWGMGIQDAISAPRFSATSNAIDVSNRIPRAVQRELEAAGYGVRRSHLSYAFAGVHGITMWDGMLEGGADPQRDGYAAGVV
jgi:gamma-glutamyltranspeptidase/glutathione hydrolase